MPQLDKAALRPVIVRVHGDIDISCRDVFRRELYGACAGHAGSLAVSLEDCAYCDCSAIGVLIGVRKKIGARLKVIIPRDSPLRRVFGRLGLLEPLCVAATVGDALSSALSGDASHVEFACADSAKPFRPSTVFA